MFGFGNNNGNGNGNGGGHDNSEREMAAMSEPQLPPHRLFSVKRADGTFESITAHIAQCGEGGTLVFLDYVFVPEAAQVVTQMKKAFSSIEWRTHEEVPVPEASRITQ